LAIKRASDSKSLSKVADNYLTLSEIEKSKGNFKNSLNLYNKYLNLKDSIYNISIIGDINHLQRLYEVSKTNQQIEELVSDKKVKENTIYYQNIILWIVIVVLLLAFIVLIFIVLQNKKLKNAYNTLVDKNIEIVEFHTKKPESVTESSDDMPEQEMNTEKSQKKVLSEQIQKELLSAILAFMENTSLICNPEFTLEKLTELIHSNQKYVSYVINNVLKKNFNTFLNGYRIREAQRLFSDSGTSKYTVEFVANKVGYKSRNSFNDAFKEITGVTPGFYVKALHSKQETGNN
jgi:AraC-like DNA-binding protein